MKKGQMVRIISVPTSTDEYLIGQAGKIMKVEKGKCTLFHVSIPGQHRNLRMFEDEIEPVREDRYLPPNMLSAIAEINGG